MPEKDRYIPRIKHLLVMSALASAALLFSVQPALAQFKGATGLLGVFVKSAPVDSPLVALLETGRAGDVPLGHADEIRAFYSARNNEPLWVDGSVPYVRAKQLVAAIRDSSTHGLNPGRYHLQEISDRLGEGDKTLQAELELFLTDAAIKYAQDMSGQRLQGVSLKGEIADLRPGLSPMDILRTFADHEDARKFLGELVPKSSTYARLREAYIDLSSKPEAAYIKYLPLDFGGAVMRPGLRHKNIPGLRARLGGQKQTDDPTLYDDALFAAVTKFQREEGLKDDGIIGLDTLAALNRSNKDRLMQLRVNMERLRWMEGQPRPDKFIVVNVAAATLWAVNDSAVDFEMPVIVGRPERPTPALVAQISGIRFNPTWTVPPTIKKEDILPKLIADPEYLTNKGIEIVRRTEEGVETLDPSSIDWASLRPGELHQLEMVQDAGDNNPLGHVRVLMPNPYSIYLHDTNQKEYFDKYARALSSGCIRMKEPLKVADFIMSGEKGWSMEKINSVIAAGKTSDRLIANKIPVYILYYTVWLDDKGRIVFGRDIYDRDKVLEEALEKVDYDGVSGHNNIMTNNPREKLVSLGEGG